MAMTAKELKALNADTAIKNLPTEVTRPGRAAKLKDLAKEDSRVFDTYARSEDLIKRYGKDAPNARSFMAYKGQSGTTKKQSGGVVKMKEGSAKDMREDKAMAKKSGMTMKQHEASAADKKHDAPKKMAKGGMVRGAGCATRGKTGAKVY